jgi:homoserine kinase type II
MAVFTSLKTIEIKKILETYDIGSLKKFHGITEGIENTNYFIKTSRKKIILTIFEKRVQNRDVPFFVNLMDLMQKKGFKCPKPIKNKKNKVIFKIKNKPAIIVSFLEGKSKKKLNNKECFHIGKEIAKFHQISSKLKIKRKNTLGLKTWLKMYEQTKKYSAQYSLKLKSYLNAYKNNKPKKLSSGIIHADLFPDNIFFKNGKFSGFIDFYFSCNESFLYELAICINALCFDKNKINKIKIKNLLKGYNSIIKIKSNEFKQLNVLCLGAAIRFFVTRLYDQNNTPKDAKIKKKDPKEYLFKMNYFYKNLKNSVYD